MTDTPPDPQGAPTPEERARKVVRDTWLRDPAGCPVAVEAIATAIRKAQDAAYALGMADQGQRVSEEFEGQCWKALRSLLSDCNFDWRDAEPDGVTAEEAQEYIKTTLDEMERDTARAYARGKEDGKAGERERIAGMFHEEQLVVWSGEFLEQLNAVGMLREPEDYEQTLAAHRAIQDELKDIAATIRAGGEDDG